jgi:hypothetical protein
VPELVIIAASADGLAVLVIAIGAAAISRGWVEGSVTVKVVPPWKRRGTEPKEPKAEPEPVAEGSSVAKLPERGAAPPRSVTEATG